MSGLDAGTLERKEQLLEAVFGAMGSKARKWLSRRDVPTSRRRHVATSQRHDVESTMQKSTSRNVVTSRRQLEICTSSFKSTNGSEMGVSRGVRTKVWNSRAE